MFGVCFPIETEAVVFQFSSKVSSFDSEVYPVVYFFLYMIIYMITAISLFPVEVASELCFDRQRLLLASIVENVSFGIMQLKLSC